jgi:hypothetical protein
MPYPTRLLVPTLVLHTSSLTRHLLMLKDKAFPALVVRGLLNLLRCREKGVEATVT